MTAVTPGSAELLALVDKIRGGTRDGWGYSREECADFIARLAAKPAEEGMREEEAAYAAYLGICVLATMCKKAGLSLAEKRATELVIEMGNAFPSFAGRSSLRTSTTGEPKR